jgi:hypothetical protein
MKGPIGRWFIFAALIAGLGFSTGAGDRLKSLWVYWAPQTILFTPTVAWDGSVYIATADNLIRGISPNGVAMWSANPGGLPSAAMALQGNVLYFPISDELVACTTSGQILWRRALGSTLCSTPAVAADGTIYETLVKGGLVALNPQGQILWSYMMADPVVTSPVVTHTGLIFVTSTKHVYLLAAEGSPVAIFPLTDQPISPMALDTSDYPYFWGATGSAYALAQNGTFRWQTEAPSSDLIPTGASPVASSSAVFLASSLGTPPPKTHTVSGTVIYLGSGLSGVTISSGSGNPSATTGNDGTYSLALPDGTYTLTPSLSTYTFNPATQTVTVSGADVKGQDFVARLFSTESEGSAVATADSGAVAESSTVTYNAGAYRLSSGAAVWTPLEVGGPHSPVVASDGILLLPSYGDQKVYLLNQATGRTEGTADVGGAPGDLVLADTAQGTRLYFQAGNQALHCFSSTLTPEPTSPWTQIGAGPRHLYRRDDPPTVDLTAPAEGATVAGSVDLASDAVDDYTNPPSVRYLVDGVAVANSSTDSPVWDSTTWPNGEHTVTAEARDSAGNVSRSQVTVTVENESPTSKNVYADDPPYTFTWDGGTETKFRVEVSTNGAFKPVLASSETPGTPWLKTTSWTPSSRTWSKILGPAQKNLTSDTTLVWRVVGKTAGTMPGSGGFLVIKKIEAATSLSPATGTIEHVSPPPTFTWTPRHTGKYQVRISDTSGFTVLRMTSKLPNHPWLTEATWTPDKDKWTRTASTYLNKTLYWEVICKDDIGRTVESTVNSMQIKPSSAGG